ncbi:hypothetical protein F889_00924 [Acinetobacter colistiniresistens]|uniref:DUF805 domain-containing protein n=1 Tax=Acinetobacter colistiniresistens TaxID=280145 RepID=N9R7X5_9GAMM|nr:DUF805 domain-containing protein [Acinetobacter colistiniresistens]ENX35257.1 hypothetical protein F889_00924 [Acinetobacter colistiniresistens]
MLDLLFNFNGRVARLPYFLFMLSFLAIFLIFIFLVKNTSVIYAGSLVCLYSTVAIQVKRWHDIGLSGWFVLLGFVPLVGIMSGLYCLFKGGEDGTNKYGEAP